MKYILVTGAYGGMGREVVRSLKNQGFCVIALDKKVGAQEENIIPVQVDITDGKSVNEAFETVHGITDELFAIIHFAGIYLLNSLVEIESREFIHAFEVNLFGAFLVNKTFLPMLKRGSRIVITTSELACLDPLPFTGIYAVTKGALDKYAYSLQMELQLLGISVSVLRAGAVDTGMLGVSTTALDNFCENTRLYSCNAIRFKKIVDGIETRCVSPKKVAEKIIKIIGKKNPKFAYSINRNPLLIIMNSLPKRLQFRIIRRVLK